MTNQERELFNEISKVLTQKLQQYTPQLFLINESHPIPLASSVLIKAKEKHFIVTASHVIEETSRRDIKICLNYEYITLGGNWYYPKVDRLDLAVMPLDSVSASVISEHFGFYQIDAINPDHSLSRDEQFYTFGYPCSKTKVINHQQKIKIKGYLTQTKLQDKSICNLLGVHPNIHILLDLNSKNLKSSISGEPIKPPEQYGMSGSGIWHIPVLNYNLQDIPLILSGIYIEYHTQQNSIVATRTLILTEFLRQHFSVNLQKSKLIQYK
ncbi:MAG: hypothetical protein ACJASM_002978 [Salibacteraceae bacterium]|jgi:hypothetical protein